MIINLAMKSHLFPKIPLLVVTTTCLIAVTSFASDKPRKAPPAKPANQYATFDAHPKEQVTVAAEPCDDPKDCDFFRLPYIQHGFISQFASSSPTTATPRSRSTTPASSSSPSTTTRFPPQPTTTSSAASSPPKAPQGKKYPLPLPLPPITVHDKPVDKQITQDEDDFGFKSTTVNAHSTLAGYLFYDVRQLNDYPLRGAELYIKMVHTLPDKDGNKKDLFDFNIPFDKWLAAQSGAKPSEKPPETSPKL